MNTARTIAIVLGLGVNFALCASMSAAQEGLSKKVTIEKRSDISTLCLLAHSPCLVEEPSGQFTPESPMTFVSQPVKLVLDRWLAHTDYDWIDEEGIIRVFPRSGEPRLKMWLNRRINIDIKNLPADKAIVKVFDKARIPSALDMTGFKNKVYPSITLHAKNMPVHEALVRILKQDPPVGLWIDGPSKEFDSVHLTVGTFFKIPN